MNEPELKMGDKVALIRIGVVGEVIGIMHLKEGPTSYCLANAERKPICLHTRERNRMWFEANELEPVITEKVPVAPDVNVG